MTRLASWTALILLALGGRPDPASAQTLPIYLEESHAGSFYYLVEMLSLNEPHTLVLFDAHCDANGIAGSDAIRTDIRRGPTKELRTKMLDAWRSKGHIQCFNWLEPLMPSPVSEVLWVPGEKLETTEVKKLETDAREYLDAHEEGFPREAGPLASHYRVVDRQQFAKESASWPESKRIVVSIDLDYFAKTVDADLPQALETVMDSVLQLRGLVAITFSISSPYLRDADQADRLITLALDAAWRIANAQVRFEPFARTGPDQSLMARLLERQGKQLPAFDLAKASTLLRTLLLEHWDTSTVRYDQAAAKALLQEWANDPLRCRIEVPKALPRTDGTWALEEGTSVSLTLKPAPIGARVRWYALRAKASAYRISEANLGFAASAPKWLHQERVLLAEGPALRNLPLANLNAVLDPIHHCGTATVFAEVERDGDVWRTPEERVCIRKTGTQGFKAAWSEQFALPYVFDSRLLARDSQTGPEAHWGADCANFITQGLRAEGWLLPWGSPADVRPYLTPVTDLSSPNDQPLLLYFGPHLAAIWEDRPPLNVLNDEDLCVHQLEHAPEILTFGQLRSGRRSPELLTIRPPAEAIRLIFAGDIMLGRKVGTQISKGIDPFESVRDRLAASDLTFGNLECVFGEPFVGPGTARKLIAPPAAIEVLKRSGFDGLSMANNHSQDLGPSGFQATAALLENANILPVGLDSRTLSAGGKKFIILGWDDSLEPAEAPLLTAIQKARALADYLIVIPHWGREHTSAPTTRQRTLATACLTAGADLIVGSGPHTVQPLEHSRQGSVAYSLGNTVFDGPGPDLHWSHGALLEVTLDAKSLRAVRMQMLATQTDDEGRIRVLDR